MPRKMQIEFSRVDPTDHRRDGPRDHFSRNLAGVQSGISRPAIAAQRFSNIPSTPTGESGELRATVSDGAAEHAIFGEGNGPIDAFVHALNKHFDLAIRILDYDEHAVGSGADAAAVCFVELRAAESDAVMGAGMHRNILTASLNAITSALNRAIRDQAGLAAQASRPSPVPCQPSELRHPH